MPSSFTDMTALRVACGNSCLRWRSSAPSVSTSSAPGSLRFVPHAHGSEVRSLPLITSHVLLRSRFAHALRSLVSQRKRRAAAHNRVVLGSENPHFEDSRDQSLGDALRTGVLGNPAIALCAVPLLIPVSALTCAHERP